MNPVGQDAAVRVWLAICHRRLVEVKVRPELKTPLHLLALDAKEVVQGRPLAIIIQRDFLLGAPIAASVLGEGQLGSRVCAVGQIHRGVAVEEAHGLQREPHALVGHHWEVLWAGNVGQTEGVPDHWVMAWANFSVLRSTKE